MPDLPAENVQTEAELEELSDRQVVDCVRNGKKQYYEVLIRRYNQQLYRVVRSYIRSDEQIKDVLQATYLKAYEHLGDFEGRSRISTWLTRIAINEALQHINRNKRYIDLPEDLNGDLSASYIEDDMRSPDHKVIRSQTRNLLEKAIDRLPGKYRVVFIMREVEEISTIETAAILKISETNVKVRLHRAKRMIRRQFDENMPDAEVFPFAGSECDEITERVMAMLTSVKNS